LQPLLLALVIYLSIPRELQRENRISFVSLIYVMLMVNAFGYIFFKSCWIQFAPKLFILVNHMSAAIMALGFYAWIGLLDIDKKKWFVWVLAITIFFLAALSDLFFMLYFFAFVTAYTLINLKKCIYQPRWIRNRIVFLMAGIAGVMVNAIINPNFMLQLHHSYQTIPLMQRIINFIFIIGWQGLWLFVLVPIMLIAACWFRFKSTVNRQLLWPLLLGLLFVTLGVALTGMVADLYSLRYMVIYFPILVFVFAMLLPRWFYQLANKLVVSLCVILMAIVILVKASHDDRSMYNNIHGDMQTILDCPAFLEIRTGALVVSTYWPAKILFEKSNRSFRLQQTTDDLQTPHDWIVNTSWSIPQFMQTNVISNRILYVTIDASSARLKQLQALPGARLICDGSVLVTG
jgi:hypothetical protein